MTVDCLSSPTLLRACFRPTLLGMCCRPTKRPAFSGAIIAAFGFLLGVTTVAGAATPDLDAAKAMVAEHSVLPTFSPPGEAFDAHTCMAGKKMLTIPVSSANPFTKNIANAMTQVAKTIGFEVKEWENQARPTQWVQGMEYAINNKFDAIDLLGGTNPAVLGPQIAAAKKAGIKIYTSHLYDTIQTPDPSVNLSMQIPYHDVGALLSNWVTVKTGGHVNAVIVGSDEIIPTAPFVKGITDTLKKSCGPDCKFTYINAPVPEWSTKIQTGVQSALIADPTINYVIPIYDSMSQFVVPALTITGRKGKVKIATFNGTPFVIDLIQKGEVEMDVGESLGWIARSILDGYMRDMCGLKSYSTMYVPFYVFDSSNAKNAGTPADYDRGYGDQHVAGYDKLWKLK
jgi:ribose transport system substrate-binding protein